MFDINFKKEKNYANNIHSRERKFSMNIFWLVSRKTFLWKKGESYFFELKFSFTTIKYHNTSIRSIVIIMINN